jgi:hypothetical protein
MKNVTCWMPCLFMLLNITRAMAEVPTVLPDPDGQAGDLTKPVKVYILAGQSNMVGMGDLSGASNMYSGVFLSSDPTVPNGALQVYKVGVFKTLGLQIHLPDGAVTEKPTATGFFTVDQQGVYRVHCGFQDTSDCAMQVSGTTVYQSNADGKRLQNEITLIPGNQYSFEITEFSGEPPRFWLEKTDLLGNGDLEAIAKREGKFPWLVDAAGEWTVRNDVYFQEARVAENGKGSPLSATSNGKSIGPELGFGHVLGNFHDEQVLLIKTAMGNRALGFDFRPPSSGRTDPDNKFEALEYKLMIDGVRKTLANIDKIVPGYNGAGYDVAGFVWFQGHKDSFSEDLIQGYEKNLVNLINDVRKEFEVPQMPCVVATVGFGGNNMSEKFVRILDAQMAVGNAVKHPEYAGTVASVDTRKFWREVDQSPRNQDYHYNRNAETYMLIGDAMGRSMVELLGGKADPLSVPVMSARATKQPVENSEDEKIAQQKSLQPIIIDGIAASYIADQRHNKTLIAEVEGVRPDRANQFLRGSMYGLVNCYQAAGITDFDWHQFGPDLDQVEWEYFSFDPPETLPIAKGNRFRKVTLPVDMENWFASNFDAQKMGWKRGRQPFGQLDGKKVPLSETCTSVFCRCGVQPESLWQKEVLLVRGTLDLPPLKPGHRYRIVLGGAAHVNSGEGYALYANGKLLNQSQVGVGIRQGGQPRGAFIYDDDRSEFDAGKVTIAAISFLRYNHPRHGVQPPRGHLTLRIEEQKLPPLALFLAK